MTTHRFFTMNCTAVIAAMGLFLTANSASGHVQLDDPNGGEVLEVGSMFTIEWHILIQHNQLNWDLWYSTTGPAGPWIVIAMDLPPGSFNVGSVHTYEWLIPDAVSDQVRVRVRMDNAGTDYEDISNGDFSIVPAPPNCPWDMDGCGIVGASDLLALLASWGLCKGCPADFDDNGIVGASDLLALLANWGVCP